MSVRMLVHTFLDVLFPPSVREARVRACTLESLPVDAALHTSTAESVHTFMNYQEPLVRDLIWLLKYRGTPEAVDLCAQLFADGALELLADASYFRNSTTLLSPVPLSRVRQRERGYNQVTRVLRRARPLLASTSAVLDESLLMRTRHTPPQTALARNERVANVRDAFALTRERTLTGTHILLVDDVVTTGATLREAAQVLRLHGASVTCIALARSERFMERY